MRPEGKCVLVTGGASGLGLATVRELNRAGAQVVICDLPSSRGEEVARDLGQGVRFAPCDVTLTDQVAAAVDAAIAAFGAIHISVSCAGTGWIQRTVDRNGPHNLDAFRRVVEVNLMGMFDVIRLSAARMIENEPEEGERGVIVNTASIAAYDGQRGQVAYAASKGGVVAMTLPIARDLAGRLIRVVTIAPGAFDTPMFAGVPDGVRQALVGQIPHPERMGNPDDFAALVRHIIENPTLNGETIRLDAALRMPPG